jgi:hypothetical protein
MNGEKLLTPKQVADIFQVPKSWVLGRTRKRITERLPHLKMGKYVRFEEGAVREFLERHRIVKKS